MRVPRLVIIGGQDVRVIYKKNLRDDKGVDLLGQCDAEKNVIYLTKGMPNSKRFSVFIHEYVHFVSSVHGWSLSEHKTIAWEIAILNLFRQVRGNNAT